MQTISTETDSDRSYGKIALIAFLGIASAFGTSYFLKQFLAGGTSSSEFASFGCAVMYLVIFVIQPILIKGPMRLYAIVVLETCALLSVFYAMNPQLLGATFTVVVLMLINGSRSEKEEIDERVKLKISKVIHHGLRNAMTALSIFAALAYVGGAMPTGEILSLDTLSQLVLPTDPIISRIYPGVSFSKSFNANARALVELQLSQLPGVGELTPAQKTATIDAAVQKLRGEVVKMIGEEIGGNDTIIQTTYTIVNKKFAKLDPQWQQGTWFALGILLFFTARGVGTLIAPLISFIVFVLFKIMIATKFAERFLEPRSREFVVMR